MARVVYDALTIDVADAASLNSIFNAFAAQTANVDGQNFGEESIDGDAIGLLVQAQEAFTPVLHTTVAQQPLTATYQQLNPGGVNPMRSTGFTLQANEQAYITASVELPNDGVNRVVPTTEVKLVIAYFDGITIRYLTSSERWYAPGPTFGNTILATQIVLSDNQTVDWVELQIKDDSGFNLPVGIGRAALTGTIYRRVS